MVERARRQARARAALDERFAGWKQLPAQGARPHGGWIRAIRDALGMSADDLAARLEVNQATVTRWESAERDRRIHLKTLEKIAEGLECEVVYALVPRRSLDEMVHKRATDLAWERLGRVSHSMALENQALDDDRLSEKVQDLASQYLGQPGLWRTESERPTTTDADRDGLG